MFFSIHILFLFNKVILNLSWSYTYNIPKRKGDTIMVNVLQENIRKTINNCKEGNKKQISLVMEERLLQLTDVIVEQLKGVTDGKVSSRNQLIELAVAEYVREASVVLLEDHKINIDEMLVTAEDQEEESNTSVRELAIFPARNEGFEKVFLGQNEWYSVRIADWRVKHIKYVACYRTAPYSAITHYAKVKNIKKYKNTNKYIIYFDGSPITLSNSVKLGANDNGVRGTRYSTLDNLINATELGQL